MTSPLDPRLAAIAESLQGTRWAAELWDSEWRLRWVSEEVKAILGEFDEEKLGYGRHAIPVRFGKPWVDFVSAGSRERAIEVELPFVIHDTPGGIERAAELWRDAFGDPVPDLRSVQPPPLWASQIDLVVPGQGTFPTLYLAVRVHGDDGAFLGTVFVYGSVLPARLIALVTRGNEAMFERMAALVEPARHVAAVLFADLQSSGSLSRRLPSAAYFELIRDLTTAMDRIVIDRQGIVGKHAGDGVTAFFLADQFESASAAAAAAIECAHELRSQTCRVAEDMSERTGLIGPDDCAINIGLHWGGTLYMGQVVTGGRLEVTALGDEVNEGARIQQSARGGAVLASKALIERLTPEDGARVGVDPEEVVYTTIAELPGVDPKALRDAGTLPVTELFAYERLVPRPLPPAQLGPGATY